MTVEHNPPENLAAVRSGAVTTFERDEATALIEADGVPPSINRGIREIMAFPMVGTPDGDKILIIELYRKAVAGFETAVAKAALSHLVFHNPRNTPTFSCPPTPQDVRETCTKIRSDWVTCLSGVYLNDDDPSVSVFGSVRRHPHTGRPGDTDCTIPPALMPKLLQEVLQAAMERNASTGQPSGVLVTMPAERFDRIPVGGFPPGLRDELVAIREAKADNEQQLMAERTYLQSLPPAVFRERHRVLAWHYARREEGYPDHVDAWTEDQIIAEVERRLDEDATQRSACEAVGSVYLGRADGGR